MFSKWNKRLYRRIDKYLVCFTVHVIPIFYSVKITPHQNDTNEKTFNVFSIFHDFGVSIKRNFNMSIVNNRHVK